MKNDLSVMLLLRKKAAENVTCTCMGVLAMHNQLFWETYASKKQISQYSKTNVIQTHFLVPLDFEFHDFNCISIWLHCNVFTQIEEHLVVKYLLYEL